MAMEPNLDYELLFSNKGKYSLQSTKRSINHFILLSHVPKLLNIQNTWIEMYIATSLKETDNIIPNDKINLILNITLFSHTLSSMWYRMVVCSLIPIAPFTCKKILYIGSHLNFIIPRTQNDRESLVNALRMKRIVET